MKNTIAVIALILGIIAEVLGSKTKSKKFKVIGNALICLFFVCILDDLISGFIQGFKGVKLDK